MMTAEMNFNDKAYIRILLVVVAFSVIFVLVAFLYFAQEIQVSQTIYQPKQNLDHMATYLFFLAVL